MAKKKVGIIIISLLLFSIVFAVLVIIPSEQASFEFESGKVYLPNYVSIYCSELTIKLDDSFLLDNKGESSCGGPGGPNSLDAYIPFGCQYFPQENTKFRIVPITNQCKFSIADDPALKGSVINVKNQEKLCINENIPFNDAVEIQYKAQPYGLRISSANGKVIFEKNCNLLTSVSGDSELDYIVGVSDKPKILAPDTNVNHYINGFSQVVNDKDVVDFNGEEIYIFDIGKYYPIETSVDGNRFANTLNAKSDNKLICVPSRSSFCIDGVTIKIENIPCSGFNKPEGYVGIGGNEECIFSCSDGILKEDVCREIASCPGDKPIRNPITNVCQSAGSIDNGGKLDCGIFGQETIVLEKDYGAFYWRALIGKPKVTEVIECKTAEWIYLVVGGAIVLILGLFAISTLTKTKRKGGRK